MLSNPVRTVTLTRSDTLRYVLIWDEGRSRRKAFAFEMLWSKSGFVPAVFEGNFLFVYNSHQEGRVGDHPLI